MEKRRDSHNTGLACLHIHGFFFSLSLLWERVNEKQRRGKLASKGSFVEASLDIFFPGKKTTSSFVDAIELSPSSSLNAMELLNNTDRRLTLPRNTVMITNLGSHFWGFQTEIGIYCAKKMDSKVHFGT